MVSGQGSPHAQRLSIREELLHGACVLGSLVDRSTDGTIVVFRELHVLPKVFSHSFRVESVPPNNLSQLD
jgi:hypothetical protein